MITSSYLFKKITFAALLLAGTLAAFSQEVTITPALPNANQKVVITFNATAAGSDLAGYTGNVVIYTAINSGWSNEVAPWGDVATTPGLAAVRDANNPELYTWTINNPRTFYNVADSVAINQLNVIFRTSAGDKQTDNIYVSISGVNNTVTGITVDSETGVSVAPEEPNANQKVVITFDARTGNKALNGYPGDLFVYTAINSGWSNQVAAWGDVATTPGLAAVRDANNPNIYTWTIKSPRALYNVADSVAIDQLNVIFRNGAGTVQTDNIYVAVSPANNTVTGVVETEIGVTVNPELPNANQNVVITFDARTGNKALEGYPGDLFIYTAVNSGWSNQVAAWGDVATTPGLAAVRDANNPNIYTWTINNPRTFYKVADSIAITQLNVIFRNGAGTVQTDNIYVPISEDLNTVTGITVDLETGISTSPAEPKANETLVITYDARVYVPGTKNINGYPGDVYVFTGINSNWTNQLAGWGDVAATPGLAAVRDANNPNIYTWTISPSPRAFYAVENDIAIDQLNVIFRNGAGTLQTENIYVAVSAENNTVTGVSGGITASEVSVYPNPSKGTFTVENSGDLVIFNIVSGSAVAFTETKSGKTSTVTVQEKGVFVLKAGNSYKKIVVE